MPKLRLCLLVALTVAVAPNFVSGQLLRGRFVRGPVRVASQPAPVNRTASPTVVKPSPTASAKPSDCNCTASNSKDVFDRYCKDHPDKCDCKCKDLNCQIHLPDNCHEHDCTEKPIKLDVYGKIPVYRKDYHCYSDPYQFKAKTKVPYIECKTEVCVEIGKKEYVCFDECKFKLCVPVNECTTKTISCQLRDREMNISIYARRENGKITYDVYVINVKDPNSPHHAGGMPAKWVLLHCATWDQVIKLFPGAKKPTFTMNGVGEAETLVESTKTNPNALVDLKLIRDPSIPVIKGGKKTSQNDIQVKPTKLVNLKK